VWVAILSFAVCFFAVFGAFFVFMRLAHQITTTEMWSGLALSVFLISSSYRALQRRLQSKRSEP
jgi:hypothetical protein